MKGLKFQMAESKNWSTPTMREVPFWKDGMSIEEYEKERDYYYKHLQEVKNGTYTPLWKQNQKASQKQGAFFVGKTMECKFRKIKTERPTSGSLRYIGFCKKYKQCCVNQCKKKTDARNSEE